MATSTNCSTVNGCSTAANALPVEAERSARKANNMAWYERTTSLLVSFAATRNISTTTLPSFGSTGAQHISRREQGRDIAPKVCLSELVGRRGTAVRTVYCARIREATARDALNL